MTLTDLELAVKVTKTLHEFLWLALLMLLL